MQSTTSPIWQPRVLHIFVMMERLTGSPRDIFANVAVDMPALRRICVLFMPLSISIFQRLLYVTLMCHYPIVTTYIISFLVSRSKHHVHFLIQWLVLYNRLAPILPLNPRHEEVDYAPLPLGGDRCAAWHLPPLGEAVAATTGAGVLSDENRMSAHWRLSAVVGRIGRRKTRFNEPRTMGANRLHPLLVDKASLECREMEPAAELRLRQPRKRRLVAIHHSDILTSVQWTLSIRLPTQSLHLLCGIRHV